MSRSSNRSPPQGQGRSKTTLSLRGRFQQARQFPGGRRLAPGEVGPQAADLLDGVGELADPAFECCLVRGQSRLKALRVASQHPRHLAEAEAERAQGCDLGGAGHLVGTVGAPSGRGADRGDQAALLVEPQGLGGNAEPFGGFGRVQELGGRAHESPRCWLTAVLIGAVPGAGSSGCSRYSGRRRRHP